MILMYVCAHIERLIASQGSTRAMWNSERLEKEKQCLRRRSNAKSYWEPLVAGPQCSSTGRPVSMSAAWISLLNSQILLAADRAVDTDALSLCFIFHRDAP